MKVWILMIGFLFSFSSFAQTPRQCENELKEILSIDGTILKPVAQTWTLNQMIKERADANAAYEAAYKVAPKPYDRYSNKRQLRTPENLTFEKDFRDNPQGYNNYIDILQKEKRAMDDAHDKAMAPANKVLNEAVKPFDEAKYAGLSNWDSKTAVTTFYFDKIEQHGTDPKHLNRVYSKDNRVTGIVMHQYDTRVSFLLNENCSIKQIIETVQAENGARWSNGTISPQLCQNRSWDNAAKQEMIMALDGSLGSVGSDNSAKALRKMCNAYAKLLKTNSNLKPAGSARKTDT